MSEGWIGAVYVAIASRSKSSAAARQREAVELVSEKQHWQKWWLVPTSSNCPFYQLFQPIVPFAGRKEVHCKLGTWSILRSPPLHTIAQPQRAAQYREYHRMPEPATLWPFLGRIAVMCSRG